MGVLSGIEGSFVRGGNRGGGGGRSSTEVFCGGGMIGWVFMVDIDWGWWVLEVLIDWLILRV